MRDFQRNGLNRILSLIDLPADNHYCQHRRNYLGAVKSTN